MTEEEIKAAASRVFDALLAGTRYEAHQPEHVETAAILTKIFRHHYTKLIANAIRGKSTA